MFASWHGSKFSRIVLCALVLGLAVAGCADRSPDTASPTAPDAGSPAVGTGSFAFVADEVVINHYAVHFDGRTFANDQTTFTYTVRGTGVDPALSHFTVELPSCAPALAAYSPTGSANINLNPQSGVYGIEWHLSIARDNLVGRTYSITFPGDVPLGIVRAEVKTEGGGSGVDYVYGPCAGITISGSVFVDGDHSGTLSGVEAGIAGVTVSATDGVSTFSALTDATGAYSFIVSPGTFTVTVEAMTSANDFNEDLFASFQAETPTSLSLDVNSDSANNNFGFSPLTAKLLADFDTGVLLTAGLPVKFWKSEFKTAISGNGPAVHTATELQSFLAQIEAFGLPMPFQFQEGSELEGALVILSDNTNTDLAKMTKQLLAAELNYFSGRTLIGQADLHEVLVLWGEELVAQGLGAARVSSGDGYRGGGGQVSEGTDLLTQMNGSTGGGGGDE